jgi:hypothetical protein
MVSWLKAWILKFGYRSPIHHGEYRLNRVSLRAFLHKLYWYEVGQQVDPQHRVSPSKSNRDFFVRVFKR